MAKTRRDFLKKLGQSSIALSFANSIIDSIALAEVAKLLKIPESEFYYLGISIPGGPARWMFDLPLYTNIKEKEAMIPNPMVYTQFTTNSTAIKIGDKYEANPNGKIQTSYHLENINGTYLPPLWNSKINFQGRDNNLDELAKNCMFLRGMHGLPFHSGYYKAYQPSLNIPSINAISTLNDPNLPLPGIQWANFSVIYNHPKDLRPLTFVDLPKSSSQVEEYFNSIFSPFIIDTDAQNKLLDIKINNSLSILEKSGMSKNIKSSEIHQLSERARSLMGDKIKNIISEMIEAYTRYLKINELSMRETIPGVDDQALFNPSLATSFDESTHVFNPDFPEIPASNYFNGFNEFKIDFRDFNRSPEGAKNSKTAVLYDLCFSLSMAEVLFKNRITNSLLLPAGLLRGMYTGGYGSRFANDSHVRGAISTNLFLTKYFQAMGHCLNQFIQQIGPDIFKKTVIHLASEFSRSPKVDASGSDHGETACQATLISGMINSTQIIGDIDYSMTDDIKSIYKGTWGQYANGKSYSVVYSMVEEMFEIPEEKRIYKNPPLKKSVL